MNEILQLYLRDRAKINSTKIEPEPAEIPIKSMKPLKSDSEVTLNHKIPETSSWYVNDKKWTRSFKSTFKYN